MGMFVSAYNQILDGNNPKSHPNGLLISRLCESRLLPKSRIQRERGILPTASPESRTPEASGFSPDTPGPRAPPVERDPRQAPQICPFPTAGKPLLALRPLTVGGPLLRRLREKASPALEISRRSPTLEIPCHRLLLAPTLEIPRRRLLQVPAPARDPSRQRRPPGGAGAPPPPATRAPWCHASTDHAEDMPCNPREIVQDTPPRLFLSPTLLTDCNLPL